MSKANFNGPLFIVGLPRSGTKLLRALLTGHPQVYAPLAETDFLPYWSRHWARFGDLSDHERFAAFYGHVTRSPYFVYMREAGRLIDCETWFKACTDYSVGAVYEALIRHDSGCGNDPAAVWCDKSPSYMNQVQLLASLFPQARFIHIVRDVRDYCISINQAWGKNTLRAAQRWVDSLRSFREAVATTHLPVHELRYEDMLRNPQVELSKACAFIGVPYQPDMLQLETSPENLGDARGKRTIVEDNFGKYATNLTSSERHSIECIARSELERYGYPCDDVVETRLSPWRLRAYQLADGARLLSFEIRQRGVPAALAFRWRAFIESGSRRH